MATLSVGGQLVATNDTLSNSVQDNITRLGTVTTGNIDSIGGVKKVASGAIANVNSFDIQGCFTSEYKLYQLWIGGIMSTDVGGGNAFTELGYLDSSNAHQTAGTYYSRAAENWNVSSTGNSRWTASVSQSTHIQTDTHGHRLINTWTHEAGSTGDEGQMIQVYFYDPNTTSKQIIRWSTTFSQTNYVGESNGYGVYSEAVSVHGLRVALATGTYKSVGHWAVYGYKA